MERGATLIKLGELETLLAFYEADEDTRSSVLAMWEDAQQPSKKVEGLSELPRRMQTLVKLQNEAVAIKYVQLLLIPGPFQTAAFATALHDADEFVRREDVERSVAMRLRRQRVLLDDPNPPRFHVVLDESVVLRMVGGDDVMADQLEHLVHLNERENVTIQVRPLTAGAYGSMGGQVMILDFADDPSSVYLEQTGGGDWVEDPVSVDRFQAVFDGAVRTSLSASETNALISARVAELRNR